MNPVPRCLNPLASRTAINPTHLRITSGTRMFISFGG